MSTPSLHPEELLDRARRGLLDADEQGRLDAHLAQCAACALERGADFEAELAPDSTDAALFERVLARAIDVGTAAPQRRFGWRTTLVAIAAALVAAGALAGALRARGTAPVIAPAAPSEPAPVAAPPLSRSAAAAPAATPEPERAKPGVSPPRPSAGHVPTASELFSQATRARHAKNDAEAIRLYRELQRRYPDSREAAASRVVLGQLLLDRTDADKALAEFDGYLKQGKPGTVTEEALVGRALALQKLGRREEERAAWGELLAKFPRSVHAARARERLSQKP